MMIFYNINNDIFPFDLKIEPSYLELVNSILEEMYTKYTEKGLPQITKKQYTYVKHDTATCGGSSGGYIYGITVSGEHKRELVVIHAGCHLTEKYNIGRYGSYL